MTPSEARELVCAEPKRWRAAFVEGNSTPLMNDPQASVRLHPTVSAAQDELRAHRDGLVKDGWKIERGSLTHGYFVLTRGGEVRAMCVDKRKRG